MKLMNIRLQPLNNQALVVIEMITPGYNAMIDPRIRSQLMMLPPDFYKSLQKQNSEFTEENIRRIFLVKRSRCSLQSNENLLLETLELTLPLTRPIIVKDFLEALKKYIAKVEFTAMRINGTPLHLYSNTTAATIQAEYQPTAVEGMLQQLELQVLVAESEITKNRHFLLANDTNIAASDLAKPASRPGL